MRGIPPCPSRSAADQAAAGPRSTHRPAGTQRPPGQRHADVESEQRDRHHAVHDAQVHGGHGGRQVQDTVPRPAAAGAGGRGATAHQQARAPVEVGHQRPVGMIGNAMRMRCMQRGRSKTSGWWGSQVHFDYCVLVAFRETHASRCVQLSSNRERIVGAADL